MPRCLGRTPVRPSGGHRRPIGSGRHHFVPLLESPLAGRLRPTRLPHAQPAVLPILCTSRQSICPSIWPSQFRPQYGNNSAGRATTGAVAVTAYRSRLDCRRQPAQLRTKEGAAAEPQRHLSPDPAREQGIPGPPPPPPPTNSARRSFSLATLRLSSPTSQSTSTTFILRPSTLDSDSRRLLDWHCLAAHIATTTTTTTKTAYRLPLRRLEHCVLEIIEPLFHPQPSEGFAFSELAANRLFSSIWS